MRVLILGASGMLGHKLLQVAGTRLDAWGTVRSSGGGRGRHPFLRRDRLLDKVDASSLPSVVRALSRVRPDCVVNCIGIVKQRSEASDPLAAISVNALFPHQLAALCRARGARLIHISTDCVFSGGKGNYSEEDIPDAQDLYGRTKLLGEVREAGCLTLRSSIVGRELGTTLGLVEWLLSRRGTKVRGFTESVFSGFSTQAFAALVTDVIERHAALGGLYHVSSESITKYQLLCRLREAYGISVDIEPSSEVRVDRSLDSARFRLATGFRPPSWESMIAEMASDPTPYDLWRDAEADV